jgi:tRNA A-37 threonylcarbamoyl transferase component Bud32/tetratricopeptide (TPR) repeat protein
MKKCTKCSTEFSQDLQGELCPACLLRQGMESQAGPAFGSKVGASAAPQVEHAVEQAISPEELMILLPQYDQIEFIGRGGMGVVYKARQKNLDRFVALKVLSLRIAATPGFAVRFSREAKAMARLNHSNIVAVYDFGCVQYSGAELYYFTMEFVDGSNLRGLLKQLTPAQALVIVPQICEALQYAHDIGIVHRDIKPENILIDKKGRVKIADFGLAKLLQQARTPTDYTLTQPDLVMGTPGYMAPEQIERPSEIDHRADLYSLGVVFYEMLTGQLPQGRFLLPSQRVQIDVRFDEIVLKALEHDRERRYQHASEVKTGVENIGTTPPNAAHVAAPAEWGLGHLRFPFAIKVLALFFAALWLLLMVGVYDHEVSAFSFLFITASMGVILWVALELHSRQEIRQAQKRGLWPVLGEVPSLNHVRRLAQAGEYVLAIKLYRRMHPASLAEAGAIVGKLAASSGVAPKQSGAAAGSAPNSGVSEQASFKKVESPAESPPAPRLSWMAIIAALCGSLILLAIPLAVVATQNFKPEYYFNGAGGFHQGPNWGTIALLCSGLILTGLSAAAMTLLGAIAVARIRRMPEKLYGLRLALFDALCCPLLLLNVVLMGTVFESISLPLGHNYAFVGPLIGLLIVFGWIVSLAFDVAVYWWLWKKLRIPSVKAPISAVKNDVAAAASSFASPVSAGSAPQSGVSDPASFNKVESPVASSLAPELSWMAIIVALCSFSGLSGLAIAVVALFNLRLIFDESGMHYGPVWAIGLLWVGLVLAGLSALTMTPLGAIDVVRIRRMPEKVYGLRLALFGALCYPLLVLDIVVVGFIFGNITTQPPLMLLSHNYGISGPLFVLQPLFFSELAAALAFDVAVYWWLWKKLRNPAGQPPAAKNEIAPNNPMAQPSPVVAATASSSPPSAATGSPFAPISPSSAREPWQFYAYAFVQYTAAWIVFLLLWNLGWAGFLLSVGLFAFIAWRQARKLQAYRPEIMAARALEPRWKKIFRPSNVNAGFVLAFMLILLGIAFEIDSNSGPDVAQIFTNPTGTLTDTTQNLLKSFQSYDPKTLSADVRDLSLHSVYGSSPISWTSNGQNNIPLPSTLPSPQLGFRLFFYPSAIPPEFRLLPYFWLFTILGLFFFITGCADMLSSRGYSFSGLGWKPAFKLAAVLIATFLVFGFCSLMAAASIRTSNMNHGEVLMGTGEFVYEPNNSAERLIPVLDRWATSHGYKIAALTIGSLYDTHRLPEVPTNVTYQAALLWKPGLFDRLGLNSEGFYSRDPEILVQSAGADSGALTSIALPVWPSNKAENDAGNALQKDLYLALNQALAIAPAAAQPAASEPAAQASNLQEQQQQILDQNGRYLVVIFQSGNFAGAVDLAKECLVYAAEFPDDPVSKDVPNQAHSVLGLAALQNNDIATARDELTKSIAGPPSVITASFGPDLTLAAALLAHGQRQTVIEYLDECSRVFPQRQQTMLRREQIVSAGQVPVELIYHQPYNRLMGRWKSATEAFFHAYQLITFHPDGSVSWDLLYTVTGKYAITNGKLVINDAKTPHRIDAQQFQLRGNQLTMDMGDALSGSSTGAPLVLNRISGSPSNSVVGGWQGTMHINDVGDAQIQINFDLWGSVSTQILTPMGNLHTHYSWDGKTLSYQYTADTGMSMSATVPATISADELTIEKFPLPIFPKTVFVRDDPVSPATMP